MGAKREPKTPKQRQRPTERKASSARQAEAAFRLRTPASAANLRGTVTADGTLALGTSLFLASDLLDAAKQCGLQVLPDADAEALASFLTNEAWLAGSLLTADELPKPSTALDKLGAIKRTAEELLRELGIALDLRPTLAHAARFGGSATALAAGTEGIEMPLHPALVAVCGGQDALLQALERRADIAQVMGQDAAPPSSLTVDRELAQAALSLAPLVLATLRMAAENAHRLHADRPKPRARGDAQYGQLVIRALAGAHRQLFGCEPRAKASTRDRNSPSVLWMGSVLSSAADRIRPDSELRKHPAGRVVLNVATLSHATLSDRLLRVAAPSKNANALLVYDTFPDRLQDALRSKRAPHARIARRDGRRTKSH